MNARAPLPKRFVLHDNGVWQAALVGAFELRGGQPRVLVRILGSRNVVDVDPRLVFETREEATELREAALALRRKPAGQHLSVRKAALHVIACRVQSAA